MRAVPGDGRAVRLTKCFHWSVRELGENDCCFLEHFGGFANYDGEGWFEFFGEIVRHLSGELSEHSPME